MSRRKCSETFSLLSIAGLTALAILMAVPDASAQGTPPPQLNFLLPAGFQIPPADQQCILPGERLNLQCIIANDPDAKRVRAEEARLEAQALAAAKSGKLDPYHQVEDLGKLEIFDPNLSVNKNIACSYCHDPAAGYGNGVSILSVFTGGSSPGSVPITVHGAYPNNRIAKRNPQSYVYASYFPPLHYNQSQADFYGGNFWDGRATGYKLQNSAAEQAQDPPLDPEEMANPDSACVVWKLSQSNYKFFFEVVFGVGSLEINWPSDVATVCSTPKGAAVLGGNPTPVQLSTSDRTLSNKDFDEFAQAIAAYESSDAVSPFTSKFDFVLAGKATLTPQEQNGYDLFRGKGSCNTCHLDGRASTLLGGSDTGQAASVQPLFTDTTYNNLGLPKNVRLPWYSEDTPDQWGFTGNPLGFGFTDEGMGLFLDGYYGAPPNLSWGTLLPQFEGKFQTSTTRNAAMVPYPGFVKAYMHNGYLLSLKEVVHFYNTRDVYPFPVLSGHCPSGTVEKVTCWPMPEDPNNENTTIGKLGLTPEEEDDIVAYLKTLVDGFKP
ncbi:MAG TPA: cytochrome c peroxidase [Candidatus Sulfotelmatobacter sp.]|nr:cytochrome c peroxidase [Candidatus Sulfotelmatobacter sp.]